MSQILVNIQGVIEKLKSQQKNKPTKFIRKNLKNASKKIIEFKKYGKRS